MEKLGKYRVIRLLGEGGMGKVYLTEHELLGIRRAVKVLSEQLAGSQGARDRFVSEARILATLRHPNIVEVYDMDVQDACYYIAMDFVSPDGETAVSVDRYLDARGRRLPHDEASLLLAQVCAAMQFAHSRDVIHRDIKPANLLMDKGGVIRVSDFGLAKIAGDGFVQMEMSRMADSLGAMPTLAPGLRIGGAADNSLGGQDSLQAEKNAADRVVGTPHFIPPEVLSGGTWSKQGDIYSIGVLTYLVLTGHYPVGSYRLPHVLDPSIPPIWDSIVERALQQRPEDRYPSAEELSEDMSYASPGVQVHGSISGTTRKTSAGEVPESAVQLVRQFVGDAKGAWDREAWYRFTITFYRYPGHDPVTPEQLEKLAEKEKVAWLDREAKRCEEEARRADEAARRGKEADDARRRVDAAKRARPLRDEAELAAGEQRWIDAWTAWGKYLDLVPGDETALNGHKTAADRQIAVLVEEANGHMAAKRFEAALDTLKQARDIDNDSAEVARMLGEVENALTRMSFEMDRAERSLRKDNRTCIEASNAVLAIDPEHGRARELKGLAEESIRHSGQLISEAQALMRRLEYRNAEEKLNQAAELDSANQKQLHSLVEETKAGEKQVRDDLASAEKNLCADPAKAAELTGRILAAAPGHAKAKNLKQAAEKNMQESSQLESQAEQQEGEKQYDEAIESFRKAIGLDGQKAERLNPRIRKIEELTASVPQNMESATNAYGVGEYAKCLERLRQVLAIAPHHGEAMKLRTRARLRWLVRPIVNLLVLGASVWVARWIVLLGSAWSKGDPNMEAYAMALTPVIPVLAASVLTSRTPSVRDLDEAKGKGFSGKGFTVGNGCATGCAIPLYTYFYLSCFLSKQFKRMIMVNQVSVSYICGTLFGLTILALLHRNWIRVAGFLLVLGLVGPLITALIVDNPR